MAIKPGHNCKKSRRIGEDLLLKSGVRDYKSKCKSEKQPGQHGDKKQRLGDFGTQLREKQKIRWTYGLLEKQFKIYYMKASKKKGSTGENLMGMLECRLDNVVYRTGFACTRAEARQLVSHKLILVNDKVVNIASAQVKAGDIIAVRSKAKDHGRIQASLALSEQRAPIDWISVDQSAAKATFIRVPEINDIPSEFNVNLVVELYSK